MALPQSIQSLSTVAGIVGLVINLYLLYGLRRVEEAQKEEREFMKRVLDIDKLDYILTLTAENIRAGNVEGVPSEDLLTEISETRGQLRGALRAIEDAQERDEADKSWGYNVEHFDYYNSGFLNAKLSAATSTIRIVCFRNQRLSSVDVLEILSERANSGVTVELFSISPELPDDVLAHVGGELRYSTESVANLREEIRNYGREIRSHMAAELTEIGEGNFEYWMYEELPKLHLVQVDDTLYVSMPHYTTGLAEHDSKELAPYICVPVASPAGSYLLSNIQYLKEKKCEKSGTSFD